MERKNEEIYLRKVEQEQCKKLEGRNSGERWEFEWDVLSLVIEFLDCVYVVKIVLIFGVQGVIVEVVEWVFVFFFYCDKQQGSYFRGILFCGGWEGNGLWIFFDI